MRQSFDDDADAVSKSYSSLEDATQTASSDIVEQVQVNRALTSRKCLQPAGKTCIAMLALCQLALGASPSQLLFTLTCTSNDKLFKLAHACARLPYATRSACKTAFTSMECL